ncbi:DUF2958 domain-containing protein [Nitrobacter sp.]
MNRERAATYPSPDADEVERHLSFTAQHSLSWYAKQARRAGMIVTD